MPERDARRGPHPTDAPAPHARLVARVVDVLRPRTKAAAGRMAICALIGGFAGWLAVPNRPMPRALEAAAPMPTVILDGVTLPVDSPGATLAAARDVARAYVAKDVEVTAAGGTLMKPRQALGARVEAARLESLVAQIHDRRSALRRAHAQHAQAGVAQPLRLPLPVSVDDERALGALLLVKDDLDRAPLDARIDLASRRIAPDEAGRRVDVYATLARLDAALVRGDAKVEAVVEAIPPARRAEQIGNVVMDDVLGYFETKYTPDQKHEARSYNLRLAASKLDGHVLLPGETFDFNEVVGPRSEANGYKVATVIAQGELVDGIGGGTCQIAGTLHGAAFFAGLDIVERKPHTRPSFYIKMGMDATVVYPTITFRFRNPFTYPVVLHETVQGGVVRAEILGPRRERDVTFVRKINDVVPFAEREVDDEKLPKGARVLGQRGIPGFKVTRQRILRDGSFAVREKTTDVYPPTSQIWRVGTGPAELKKAEDDEHPEYVADEYLVISQGPHVIDPRTGAATTTGGGATVESRVAGRYGTRGWTVREGFSHPTPGSADIN